ncbi:MAG: ATP-binding cassette domain-containing protein [Thermodesulfobacteriota bacterium]|nr:ATP-binding cassette domain-containing protein [Thermodesulfobacteriota bacterium]
MIRFENVRIARNHVHILQEVSFHIRSGEKIGFTGPSGSGKSTLLLALLGVFPVSDGRILFNGKVVSPATIREVRRSIAYIAQEPVLGAETVRDAILLPFTFRSNRSQKPDNGHLENLLAKVRLTGDILDRRVTNVSGGEKQRIAVARALLLGKRVFLCDEITSALDPESRDVVLDIFANPDFTMVSVSHDEKWLAACHRRLTVADGTVKEKG